MERLSELDPLVALAVFGSAFAIDAVSTIYTRRAVEGKALEAAVASAGLLVLSAITLYTFMSNRLYLIPEATGAFLGTWVAVRKDSQRKRIL